MKDLYYLDDENNIVESGNATHAVLREVDENGKLLKETFFDLKKPNKRNTDIIDIYEPTPEMKKVLDEFVRSNKVTGGGLNE